MKPNLLAFLLLLTVGVNSTLIPFKNVPGSFRKLKIEGKEKICQKGYQNYTIPNYSSVDSYSTAKGFKDNHGTKLLTGIVFENKVEDLSGILSDVMPYLIFIICAVLVFLTWPIFLLCFCCGCCCFDKNVKSGICGLVFYIIAMSFMGGVIISGIVGFVKAKNFSKSIDGSICSLLNFFDHFIDGDESTSDTKWVGLTNLNLAVTELTQPIKKVQEDTNNGFDKIDKSKLDTNKNDYSSNLDTDIKSGPSEVKYKDEVITTEISKEYQPQNTQGFVVQSKLECAIYIEGPTAFLPEIKDAQSKIKNLNSIETQLNGLAKQVSSMGTTVSKSADSMVQNIVNVKDKAQEVMLFAFEIIFGIFLGIAVILMVILTLYALVNCFLFKIPLHIMWNIVLVICILNFILGAILGILAYITSILSPTMAYFVSPDFIQSPNCPFAAEKPIPDCINTCINGDGNLYNAFDVPSMLSGSDDIDTILDIGNNVTKLVTEMTGHTSSKAIADYKERLTSYEQDLTTLTANSENGNLKNLLTDLNNEGKAKYVLKKEDCGTSSTYENDCKSDVAGKCCVVEECTDSSNEKAKSLANYVKSLKDLITKEKEKMSKLDQKYSTAASEIQTEMSAVNDVISDLMNVVSGYMNGDAGLIKLFNCGFIGKDLIAFMDQLYFKFSGSCKGMAIACGTGAVLSYVGVIMVLRAIYRNGPKARENSKKKVEKDKEYETIHNIDPEKIEISSKK